MNYWWYLSSMSIYISCLGLQLWRVTKTNCNCIKLQKTRFRKMSQWFPFPLWLIFWQCFERFFATVLKLTSSEEHTQKSSYGFTFSNRKNQEKTRIVPAFMFRIHQWIFVPRSVNFLFLPWKAAFKKGSCESMHGKCQC